MKVTVRSMPVYGNYYCLSEDTAIAFIDEQVAEGDTGRSEAWEQKKIMDDLEAVGFQVDKNVVSNKAGNADLTAWSPVGQIWKIEVKTPKGGVLAPLQRAKLMMAWQNNAVVMVAYGHKDFRAKFKLLKEAENEC